MVADGLLALGWFGQISDVFNVLSLQIHILIDTFTRISLLTVAQFRVETHVSHLESGDEADIVVVGLALLLGEFGSQTLMISTDEFGQTVVGVVMGGDGE
jgi:hypothetical protein